MFTANKSSTNFHFHFLACFSYFRLFPLATSQSNFVGVKWSEASAIESTTPTFILLFFALHFSAMRTFVDANRVIQSRKLAKGKTIRRWSNSNDIIIIDCRSINSITRSEFSILSCFDVLLFSNVMANWIESWCRDVGQQMILKMKRNFVAMQIELFTDKIALYYRTMLWLLFLRSSVLFGLGTFSLLSTTEKCSTSVHIQNNEPINNRKIRKLKSLKMSTSMTFSFRLIRELLEFGDWRWEFLLQKVFCVLKCCETNSDCDWSFDPIHA